MQQTDTPSRTEQQFFKVVSPCRDLFLKKAKDYGTSWRILRMPSITDQIYIKAERIRTLEETGVNKVGDSIEGEFQSILNYCVIALMLSGNPATELLDDPEHVAIAYDTRVREAWETLDKKNHDYGEAWRNMRVSSFTDLILMKLLRLKQIEDNKGKTLVSEGPEANYIDIFNYAVFALIKLTLEN